MVRLKHVTVASLLLLSANYSHADTAYVTDTVTVSVFATSELQGEPVERLVSGTLVDILQAQGGVAEIKSHSGKTGWLRTTFLTTNLPADIKLENAAHELSKTRGALAAANEQIAALEQKAKAAAKDAGWMKAEMEKARNQAKALESQLTANKTQATAINQQSESIAEQLADLKAEKADLEQRLAATLMINTNTEMLAEESEEADSGTTTNFPWSIVAVLLSLGAGFAAGYAWLDRRVRKHFGGLRVY